MAGAQFEFKPWSDGDFLDRFIQIISNRGRKNNTYKFAWARFLLDHSFDPGKIGRMYEPGTRIGRGPPDPSVKYAGIARYFFHYYWPLACKTKLRQGPVSQPPEVIRAIKKEFDGEAYPETVEEIIEKNRAKVDRCLKKITKHAFEDVVHRFQKVDGEEDRMFYQYAAGPPDKSGNRSIDRAGGILMNPKAMKFLRRNHGALHSVVIMEWVRAIERLNFGSPNLTSRLSGEYGIRNQRQFLNILKRFEHSCFYCGTGLDFDSSTHVDHVIPFDYMGDTELWNLVLACQRCNCEKLGSLPPRRYIDRLVERNLSHHDNRKLRESMDRIDRLEQNIGWHYENAKRHGYHVKRAFPRRGRV